MNDSRAFWDRFYGDKQQVWSGEPNDVLVRHVTGLAPGRALDLGCGEGADAIWLAKRGWRVTAVDVSRTALDRAAAHARAAGVEHGISWGHHDLTASIPTGPFDLVAAVYLHSPVNLPRDDVLRRASRAVTPGGVLLIVGHAGLPHGDAGTQYPTPDELLDSLALAGAWTVEVFDSFPRSVTTPDGHQSDIQDTVVMLRR